ncbi:MAG TPA: 4a-hydroxytetrahydrobiopterin dehydratase [Candidatus Dormibacteraeota bacterium]|jgi:4a-hydroxytetrahydrobiopterin dehydratase|nr:4a-hydroxytetrahydrobiopterin dehydratase [Candidatus Dormibacteraeota bacterium]
MSPLAQEACQACTGSTPVVAASELDALRAELHDDWRLDEDARGIRRTVRFPDFAEAFAFATRVAFVAENEGHHPDILIGWGRCEVRLTTHAVNGLTRNDFIVAAKVDRILSGR